MVRTARRWRIAVFVQPRREAGRSVTRRRPGVNSSGWPDRLGVAAWRASTQHASWQRVALGYRQCDAAALVVAVADCGVRHQLYAARCDGAVARLAAERMEITNSTRRTEC